MMGRGPNALPTPTLTLPHQEGRENILEEFQISLASILSHKKKGGTTNGKVG
jgi:hypothetical protein